MKSAEQEAQEFFKKINEQIKEENKNKKAINEIVKRETKQDISILDYCKEHHLDKKTAREIRDTKIILEEADKLNINNPIECMLYNQLMSGLDCYY